jgi:hypothetical protein
MVPPSTYRQLLESTTVIVRAFMGQRTYFFPPVSHTGYLSALLLG